MSFFLHLSTHPKNKKNTQFRKDTKKLNVESLAYIFLGGKNVANLQCPKNHWILL